MKTHLPFWLDLVLEMAEKIMLHKRGCLQHKIARSIMLIVVGDFCPFDIEGRVLFKLPLGQNMDFSTFLCLIVILDRVGEVDYCLALPS